MLDAPVCKPRSEFLYPRAELSGLIPFVVLRDTRGAQLDHQQRFNHFAASPLCGISLSLEGIGHVISTPEEIKAPHRCPVAPKLCFAGPHPKPLMSWNPGEVHLILICFYPDAFETLTSIDPFAHEQSFVDVGEILSGPLLDATLKMQEPGSGQERFDRFQDLIAPVWASKRPRGAGITNRVSDWARLAIMRAALSERGKSMRAFERRMRSMIGMSKRQLNLHAKAEDTFALAYAAQRQGALDLAALASDAGFADQSHMGRLTKRITGHSPDQLMRLIENDEAYWSYRLIGEHISEQG